VRALQFLGVTAKNPVEALNQVVAAMAKYEGGAGKIALATALFNKSGGEFLATLDSMAKLQDVVGTVTSEQARASEELLQTMRRLELEGGALKQTFLSEVVPSIEAYAAAVLKARQAGLGWWDSLRTAVTANTSTNLLGAIKDRQDELARLQSQRDKAEASPMTYGQGDRLRGFDEAIVKVNQQIAALQRLEKERVKALGYTGDRYDQMLGNGAASITPGKGPADFTLRDKVPKEFSSITSVFGEIETRFATIKALYEGMQQIQQDATNRELTILDQQHSVALISEQDFITKRMALQQEGEQNAITFARSERDRIAAQLADVYATPVKGNTQAQIDENTLKKHEQINKLLAEQDKAQTHLAIVEAAEGDAARGAATAWLALQQRNTAAVTQIVQQTNDYVRSLSKLEESRQLDIELIGKTAEEQEKLRLGAQLRLDLENKLLDIDRHIQALSDTPELAKSNAAQIQQLKDSATQLTEQTARTTQNLLGMIGPASQLNAQFQLSVSIWQTFDQVARSVFDSLFQKGKSFFQNLVDTAKAQFLNLAYFFGPQRLLFNAALGLSPGLAQAAFPTQFAFNQAQQGGGLTGLPSSLTQSLGGAGSIASLFGGATTFGASVFGAEGAGVGFGVGSSIAGGMGGLMAGLAAAVPWVALAAVAVPFIASLFDKGPADRTGYFGSNAGLGQGNPLFQSSSQFGRFGIDRDSYFSNADMGTAIQSMLTNVKGLDNAIAAIVGSDQTGRIRSSLTGSQQYSFGTEHTDLNASGVVGQILKDRYTAVLNVIDTRLGALVQTFEGTGEELGQFVLNLANLSTVLPKLSGMLSDHLIGVVAKFQGSGQELATFVSSLNTLAQLLPKLSEDVGDHLVNALDGLQSTTDKVIAIAQGLVTVSDLLKRNPMQDAIDALVQQSGSAYAAFLGAADALGKAITGFDGTTEATNKLTAATQGYYNAQVALLAQIVQTRDAISGPGGLIPSAIRSATLSSLTPIEQAGFYNRESQNAQGLLQTAVDPADIHRYASLIVSDAQAAFNLLAPEEQRAQLPQFTAFLNGIDTLVQQRLTDITNSVTGTATNTLQDANTTLLNAATTMDNASGTMQGAAASFNTAVASFNSGADKINASGDKLLTATSRPISVIVDLHGNPFANELSPG
jgi:hypothetical protein